MNEILILQLSQDELRDIIRTEINNALKGHTTINPSNPKDERLQKLKMFATYSMSAESLFTNGRRLEGFRIIEFPTGFSSRDLKSWSSENHFYFINQIKFCSAEDDSVLSISTIWFQILLFICLTWSVDPET
jgi:hypothetical protein